MISDSLLSMPKIHQRLEIYQRSGCSSVPMSAPNKYRRIASLPNSDDDLYEFLLTKYREPFFKIRIITEFY